MPQDNFGFQSATAKPEEFGFQPASAPVVKEPQSNFDWWVEQGLRTVPPVVGGLVGGAFGGIPGAMAGGAGGSALGNIAGQWYHGDDFNPVELGVETALGAVPPIFGAPKLAGLGIKEIAKYTAKNAASGAVEGGIVSAGATPFQHYAREGNFDAPMEEYLANTGAGALFGAGTGGTISGIQGLRARNVPAPPIDIPRNTQGELDLGPIQPRLPGVPSEQPGMRQGNDWVEAGAIEGPEVGPYGTTKQHPQLPLELEDGQLPFEMGPSPTIDDFVPLGNKPITDIGTTPSVQPDVIVWNGGDAVELNKLRAQGYVPWVGHRSPEGKALLIKSGKESAAVPTSIRTPEPMASPDASGTIPFNNELRIPRQDVSSARIQSLTKQGFEIAGEDAKTGEVIFRQIDEGPAFESVDPPNPVAIDRLKQPMGEVPRQLSLEEQMKDAEIDAYLKNEDATPPEMIDLSQYGQNNPTFARASKGKGLVASVDITRAVQNITKDYTSPLSGIMAREGLQNALDAADRMGQSGRVKIRVNEGSDGGPNSIEIYDNGSGLDEDMLSDKLVTMFATGKENEAGATGGKGIGSASYIFGGDHFQVETVATDRKDGLKYRITASGTPDQFLDPVEGSNWERIEVPMDTPTGTTIKVDLKADQATYNARKMVEKIISHTRNRPSKILFDEYGSTAGKPLSEVTFREGGYLKQVGFNSSDVDKLVGDFTTQNSRVKVLVPKTDNVERSMVQVHFLNNGMYQFSENIHAGAKAKGMPEHALVDIHPLVDEMHDDYPFINTREDVKKDIRETITKYIKENITKPALDRQKNRTQELYDSMSNLDIKGTNRKPVLFDPGNRLTPEEITGLNNNPVVRNLVSYFDNLIDNIVRTTDREAWMERLEGVGLSFHPDSHGMHIPNPTTGKSTIIINPFIRMEMGQSPKSAALDAVGTGLHEAAHIGKEHGTSVTFNPGDLNDPRIGEFFKMYLDQVIGHGDVGFTNTGHGMDFTHRLGEVYGAYGAKNTFESAAELEYLYTGGNESGGYSPEVQKLLQLYTDSRGRDATTEDILSGTGVKQANRGRKGERDISGIGEADGDGTTGKSVDELIAEAKNKGPGKAQEWYNLSRGVTTTADLSAPMRQGLPLITTKAWWTSWVPMVKALGSEKAFQKTLSDIQARPMFQNRYNPKTGKVIKSFALESGVKINDLSNNLNAREESIASNWAESGDFLAKIPGAAQLYKKTAGRVARASNRAYTAYLNQLRADSFESLVKDAVRISDVAGETGKARPGIFKQSFTPEEALELNPYNNKMLAKQLGDFVNTATGRGPLKISFLGEKEHSFEQNAKLLTNTLFSPRLFASRMRMLMPGTYMMATPQVRKQYLKSAIAVAGAWGTVSTLAKIAGAEVSSDTNSADFGKIKIGNTRLDPAAGFQQYIVAISRLISGHTTSSGTGRDFELGQGYQAETRGDIAQRFMTNKLHPIAKFANDIAFASKYQPFHVADRTMQLFVPLIIGDLTEILKEDPSMLPLLAPVAAGMGTQTYGKGESTGKFIPPESDYLFEGGGSNLWE